MDTATLRNLLAQGQLREALEILAATHTDATALLAEYHRGARENRLNTISFSDWNRIQNRLTLAALEMLSQPQALQTETIVEPKQTTVNQPKKVFLSYAHADEEMKNTLRVFLKPLERSGKIDTWTDREIIPGQEWDAAIKQELAAAHIILLLVSPHFLASDYIWEHEISKAMDRHRRSEATVIPIILRPCDWQDMPFAGLQGLPKNARPVTAYPNADEAYMEIVVGVKRVLGT